MEKRGFPGNGLYGINPSRSNRGVYLGMILAYWIRQAKVFRVKSCSTPKENLAVFLGREASEKNSGRFKVSIEGQNGPSHWTIGEEKAAEQVIFPTIHVIFERRTGFLWPDSMTQMS